MQHGMNVEPEALKGEGRRGVELIFELDEKNEVVSQNFANGGAERVTYQAIVKVTLTLDKGVHGGVVGRERQDALGKVA